jgi:hypothetical protein
MKMTISLVFAGKQYPLAHRLPPFGSWRFIAKCEANGYLTSPSRHTKVLLFFCYFLVVIKKVIPLQ